MASCGWVDVVLYLVTRRTILTLQNNSLSSSGRSQQPMGAGDGISMSAQMGSQIRNSVRGHMHNTSSSGAITQSGFVKLEHVVEVTVESADLSEQISQLDSVDDVGEEGPLKKKMGNTTTITGTHYW